MKTKTRHPFNLQSELARLELNGACSYDGKPLILPEQAYCAYDCYHGIAQYVATTLAAPPIAPTIPITKTNTVSCSATKTCAAYKPVPQSPAKP